MDIQRILTELKQERDRLAKAIDALEGGISRNGLRAATKGKPGRRRRRHLSPEARRRLSQMMKQRWAERKKAKRQ